MVDDLLSIRGYRWKLADAPERQVLAVAQQYQLPEIIARLLVSRGIEMERIPDFLNPTLRTSLPDPLHLLDMDKAIDRMVKALDGGESIAVFGDYDVDGATSSALLVHFFRALGKDLRIYIPDRMMEGYGPNEVAFQTLKEEGHSLVLTVDCGTAAHEALAAAEAMGLDVVVLDHHLGSEGLPPAAAIVNPNRLDEASEHRNLAAVGVTFLFLVALNARLRESGWYAAQGFPENGPDLRQWLDIVALGTVCDVMTLTGVNRAFVAQGLKILTRTQNPGLQVLIQVGGLKEHPQAWHFGFVLGPRINAGGRVGESGLGAQLLTTEDTSEAMDIALRLDHYNKERQALEAQILEEATAQAEAASDNLSTLLLHGEGWHPGVIGIVASRVVEKCGKPTAVIAFEDGVGKASARSIAGVDLGAAVVAAKQAGLLEAGGGHSMAAGFTVRQEKLEALQAFFEERLVQQVAEAEAARSLTVDAQISPTGVTLELLETLSQLEPYGMGNRQPRLMLPSVRIVQSRIVGANHVQCTLAEQGALGTTGRLSAIAFRATESPLGEALLNAGQKTLAVVGQAKVNHFNGTSKPQFHIEDARYL